MKLDPYEAASRIIEASHQKCRLALLSGSVVRGEETTHSDLDIVIIDEHVQASYRESIIAFGWPMELFIHNLTSYRTFFEDNIKRMRPSLQQMVFEGIPIIDDGLAASLKEEAECVLKAGPPPLTEEEIKRMRYALTDALDDFEGCEKRSEGIFIAGMLATLVHEFILRTNRQWLGASKWIVRALKRFNPELSMEYVWVFDSYYMENQKQPLIHFVDRILAPYGGRLFDGFSIGKG